LNSKFDDTRFLELVRIKELSPQVATQLKDVLSNCEIVILCDDSASMNNKISEEGTDPFSFKNSTRWMELKKLTQNLIDFVTPINRRGLDLYFMNRGKVLNVTDCSGLSNIFSSLPNGSTPLLTSLQTIYNDKRSVTNSSHKLLILVVTDGEPTDGSRNDLFNLLTNLTSSNNVHISFAECTDNAEDMEYLDRWNGQIRNFDNTDDYREEVQRVKQIQGQQFKFDFTDYIIKILLATFVKWYFNLDQRNVGNNIGSVQNNNFQNNNFQNNNFQNNNFQNNNNNLNNLRNSFQPNLYSRPVDSRPMDSKCCVII